MQIDRKNLKVTKWIQAELTGSGCKTVLDLGCGQSSLLQYVDGIDRSTGVECWAPYIEESRSAGIHSDYLLSDIMDVQLDSGSYDAVLLFDVLEHIEKDKGITLLARMRKWARKKVIISVPNGFMIQGDTYGDGNMNQHHVSGWNVNDFRQQGYRVRGFDGWKPLRGDGAGIIPTSTKTGHYLLAGISKLSEPIVGVFPNLAFHLFAVLDVEKIE
jgi:hypothetical protein